MVGLQEDTELSESPSFSFLNVGMSGFGAQILFSVVVQQYVEVAINDFTVHLIILK